MMVGIQAKVMIVYNGFSSELTQLFVGKTDLSDTIPSLAFLIKKCSVD
jgi:hypothetical protein